MGLIRTLNKENNSMYVDFPDAYWSIESIMYNPEMVQFVLMCYPSREAKYKNYATVKNLPFGSPFCTKYETNLYAWHGAYPLRDVFPDGIPVDVNEQKTAIYNFLKSISDFEFTDVIED